jgi:hypothetical protein
MRYIVDKIQLNVPSDHQLFFFAHQFHPEKFQADSFCSIACELD